MCENSFINVRLLPLHLSNANAFVCNSTELFQAVKILSDEVTGFPRGPAETMDNMPSFVKITLHTEV